MPQDGRRNHPAFPRCGSSVEEPLLVYGVHLVETGEFFRRTQRAPFPALLHFRHRACSHAHKTCLCLSPELPQDLPSLHWTTVRVWHSVVLHIISVCCQLSSMKRPIVFLRRLENFLRQAFLKLKNRFMHRQGAFLPPYQADSATAAHPWNTLPPRPGSALPRRRRRQTKGLS